MAGPSDPPRTPQAPSRLLVFVDEMNPKCSSRALEAMGCIGPHLARSGAAVCGDGRSLIGMVVGLVHSLLAESQGKGLFPVLVDFIVAPAVFLM